MAIEFCSENSNMSPRISFSNDFSQSDVVPVEQQQQHPLRSNSTSIDFDFCVRQSIDQDSSSADELFSNGKILPTEIKKKNPPLPLPAPAPRAHDGNGNNNEKNPSKECSKESKIIRDEAMDDEAEEKQNSKSFWRFNRSSSLNCGGSGYGRSLCPLPPLSRSNSTGSTSKDSHTHNHKHSSQKQAFVKASQFSCSTSNCQKPPLKKNYGSGVRVNPVLNVPSGNLFGLGSFFSNGKDKNKKK